MQKIFFSGLHTGLHGLHGGQGAHGSHGVAAAAAPGIGGAGGVCTAAERVAGAGLET